METADELRAQIERARSALRQAVEFNAGGWERVRHPRPGEAEAWSPRQAAEHAIAADLGFTAMISRAVGPPQPQPPDPWLPSVAAALGAIEQAERFAQPVLARLEDDDLILETDLGVEVGDVMRLAAQHLHEHARQIAGVA